MTVGRRLAAILAADVAGYFRLMGWDEECTLERLKAHRRESTHLIRLTGIHASRPTRPRDALSAFGRSTAVRR